MTNAAADLGLLDLDAWDRLEPVETKRRELVDGVLIVSPRPQAPHVVISSLLIVALADAGALGLAEPELVLADDAAATVRVPDLIVLRPGSQIPAGGRFAVSDVMLAVEIVSPGSRRTDYIAKRYDYEQAGIDFYWIVDPDERRVTCLELRDGRYVEYAADRDGDSMIISRRSRSGSAGSNSSIPDGDSRLTADDCPASPMATPDSRSLSLVDPGSLGTRFSWPSGTIAAPSRRC